MLKALLANSAPATAPAATPAAAPTWPINPPASVKLPTTPRFQKKTSLRNFQNVFKKLIQFEKTMIQPQKLQKVYSKQ